MTCDEPCAFCGQAGLVWVLFPPGKPRYCCRSCSKLTLMQALDKIAEIEERELAAAAPKETG